MQPYIGKEKLPFELSLLYEQQHLKIVAYQDQNLTSLKLKLEKRTGVAYHHQKLSLITPYK
jgi:hypothetical protein